MESYYSQPIIAVFALKKKRKQNWVRRRIEELPYSQLSLSAIDVTAVNAFREVEPCWHWRPQKDTIMHRTFSFNFNLTATPTETDKLVWVDKETYMIIASPRLGARFFWSLNMLINRRVPAHSTNKCIHICFGQPPRQIIGQNGALTLLLSDSED